MRGICMAQIFFSSWAVTATIEISHFWPSICLCPGPSIECFGKWKPLRVFTPENRPSVGHHHWYWVKNNDFTASIEWNSTNLYLQGNCVASTESNPLMHQTQMWCVYEYVYNIQMYIRNIPLNMLKSNSTSPLTTDSKITIQLNPHLSDTVSQNFIITIETSQRHSKISCMANSVIICCNWCFLLLNLSTGSNV